ncbi:hypothetical protein TD95_001090 [Thielaviopsis punctulata]|uniref:NADH:flavin oxidoreductase/NADH oxidase N-terminal domain-containing protein n=1 Tax=Thielaviopsis punctulata TaxID=72032 RepID=A0A0F4ZL56_9PEZI|nr:hypothetical protein TD95_001090 [Thielaviopsis punctulata]
MTASSKLFSPLKIGHSDLQHRVIMAPMTRLRCDDDWTPTDMVKEHYVQRASVPGTLIFTEGVHISKRFIGLSNVGGIWSSEQIAAWKEITDAVHEKGSFIWCQLWTMGRGSTWDLAEKVGTKVFAPSPIPLSTSPDKIPTEMTKADIQTLIDDYVQAAKNCMEAGFDGIHLHAANGHLIDQFLQDITNKRTDEYGGSIENRSRLAVQVLQALVDAIGADRVGVRFSPWGLYGEVGMPDPVPQFSHVIRETSKLKLAFLDMVEPLTVDGEGVETEEARNDVMVKEWTCGTPVILSGGFMPDSAKARVDGDKEHEVAITFGRYFTSNPDLPFRIRENLELTPYNRPTFYTPLNSVGYTDWPASPEFLAAQKEQRV